MLVPHSNLNSSPWASDERIQDLMKMKTKIFQSKNNGNQVGKLVKRKENITI